MIIAATGHRPNKAGGYRENATVARQTTAMQYLEFAQPESVIQGMAQGWDIDFGIAAVKLGIPVHSTIPFTGHGDNLAPLQRYIYDKLLADSKWVTTVDEEYNEKSFQNRNIWMVDHSDHLAALWDGSFGGTYNCIEYARTVNRTMSQLWPLFQRILVR